MRRRRTTIGRLPHEAPRSAPRPRGNRFTRWFLEDRVTEPEGPFEREHQHPRHAWYQVMCLTGVDYFSTLGYQPGIAFLAAQALSPIATLILVLLTLFGALPIYRRVAAESPHGGGALALLEGLLSWWQGKLFVLCLLGFVATDFIVTITLSAADATTHIIENPYAPEALHRHGVLITLVLIGLLSAVFLKGLREAIGIAVVLVGAYLLLNVAVIAVCTREILLRPEVLTGWKDALILERGDPIAMLGAAVLLFPKLALGLSGFETGVDVMPLVRGFHSDTVARPRGRVKNTKRLLTSAALIMSVFLISSSLATTVLIPAREFQQGGQAYGRALAFLAHRYLGDLFGTIYDASTVGIVWFAGASAMAGLLNIVPRYLPRYGMAPAWARAMRPLVVLFTAIAFTITIIFQADVGAQGGAYATGVLVLMSSASVAVTISAWRKGERRRTAAFGAIALVFAYTTVVNVIERPDGVKIAACFIGIIVVVSAISRAWRTTELRVERIELDETARRFLDALLGECVHIIANSRDRSAPFSYAAAARVRRKHHRLRSAQRLAFLEIEVDDSSEFAAVMKVRGLEIDGQRVFRARGTTVPNGIAAFLLFLRDETGKLPHIYFAWGEKSPAVYVFNYLFLGEGDIGPMTREVLRLHEPEPRLRPAVHIGA